MKCTKGQEYEEDFDFDCLFEFDCGYWNIEIGNS